MSPTRDREHADYDGFPRVSGDEPHWTAKYGETYEFSPRERG